MRERHRDASRPGRGVGADVLQDVAAQPAQPALRIRRQLEVEHGPVGLGGAGGVVAAGAHPGDGPPEAESGHRGQDLLRIAAGLGAEAPADVLRQNPDLGRVEAEDLGHVVADAEDPLGRGPNGQAPQAVGRCRALARLHGRRGHAFQLQSRLHHDRVRRERRLDVSVSELGAAGEMLVAGGGCAFDPRQRRQRVELCFDRRQGVVGLVAVLGDHDRQRLAGVADHLTGQERTRPRRDLEGRAFRIVGKGEIGSRPGRHHPRQGAGGRGVDREHSGVGQRRAVDGQVAESLGPHIGRVPALPPDQRAVLAAGQPAPDIRLSRHPARVRF